MADDVWTALVKGILSFGQTRAADLVGDSFSDTGSFVGALAEGDGISDDVKDRFEALKTDIENLIDVVKPIVDKVKPKISAAKTAVENMATELGTDPFTMEAAARAAVELAFVLKAVDEALEILAEEISKDENGTVQPAIRDAILGMSEPWKLPFRQIGADVTRAFDLVAKQALDIDDAGSKFADLVEFDRNGKELRIEFAKAERRDLGVMSLEDTTLVGFLNFKEHAILGVRLRTKLEAGLRSDALLEKVIPGGANPSAESTMITLDTDDGLTFGDGKNRQLTLPVSFSFPGLELREFVIGLPADEDADERFEIHSTLAAKLGDVMGLVIEGAGVTLTWSGEGGNAFSIEPRLPTGMGVRVSAGPVTGGGFIRREDKEYSGILDLKLGEFRITAIGMLVTDPFSFVVILSIRFSPSIQLGMGFTLNGLGGILAIDRTISTDALRAGIRDGTASTLLFPEDPLAAALTILDKVRDVFPPHQGGFVVGPIAEIGWGSEAGFVVAKVGIVLSLPDPKLILLGALEIGVPSTKVPDGLKIVDLKAEVYGEFTPDYLLFLIGLSNSKLAGIPISGDIGLLIRWAGGAEFALSVGGFFPGFEPPPELAGMRRIAIDLSPAKWLSLRAEGYFAITSNSLQFGGGIRLKAKLGPAKGEAWLTLDALFKWSPRFYFEVRITAGISISVFGVDVFGVDFKGTLKGTTPWSIEGHASISMLFWSFDFDLGPFTWGESDTSSLPTVSPRAFVAEALSDPKAWTMELPSGLDTFVELIEDNETPLLVHPLGALEVKQLKAPLETTIDRVGSSKVSESRVNLTSPTVQGVDANVVSHSEDRFAPGQFIKLKDEEQVSRPAFETLPAGMRVAASQAASFGPSSSVALEWETAFPKEPSLGRVRHRLALTGRGRRLALRTTRVAQARRLRSNPYLSGSEPVELRDPALREVRRRDDLGAIADVPGAVTVTSAKGLLSELDASTFELVTPGTLS